MATKNILLVDDNVAWIALMGAMLKDFGDEDVNIEYATSGEEGIKKYMQMKPVFVFLDMKMPGIDGLETFRRIDDFDNSANVFVVTGYSDDAAADAIRLGAKGYISKSMDYISMMASLVIAFDKVLRMK